MVFETNCISRRGVLKLAGGSVAAAGSAGSTGLGSATATVEVDVGVASERGRRAAHDAADETVREFDAMGVLTLRLSERAAAALESNPDVRYVERRGRTRPYARPDSGASNRRVHPRPTVSPPN